MHSVNHYESRDGVRRHVPGDATGYFREIVKTSPTLAALLPGVMRRIADEIEMLSDARTDGAAGWREHHGLTARESLAGRLAAQIALALNNNLRLHQIDDTADLSNTVLDDTPANCLQPSKVRTNNQPSTPQLSLKLLGAPEIALDGMRLTALEQSTSAALVLYVLALHRGGLSGERLMAYLVSEWEDMDPLDAGATLSPSAHRTYIWRLRKLAGVRNIVVAHAVEGRHHSRYLLPNNTTCDLWEFEDNLDQAARLVVRASFEPDAADRAAALRQEAILLYGGDFCQGVGAGAIARAADYLRQRYLQAVMSQAAYWKDKAMKLCDARQRTGIMGELSAEEEHAWLEALNNYRLVVHVEPYEESAYAGVELCKARLGQRRISMRRKGTRSRAQDPDRDVSSLLSTTPSA